MKYVIKSSRDNGISVRIKLKSKFGIPIPDPKDSVYKAPNDKKRLNKNVIAVSRENCRGDILVRCSAMATIKVIIVIIIMISPNTLRILLHGNFLFFIVKKRGDGIYYT